jgi:hypothetical protein
VGRKTEISEDKIRLCRVFFTLVGSTVVPSDTAHLINSLIKATSSMFFSCGNLLGSDSWRPNSDGRVGAGCFAHLTVSITVPQHEPAFQALFCPSGQIATKPSVSARTSQPM